MQPFLLLFCSHGELKRTRLNWFVWSSVNSIIHASPDRKCIETCCLFLLLEQCLYCCDLHASVHSLLGAVCKITRCTCILHVVAFCFHSRNSSLSHLCVLFVCFFPTKGSEKSLRKSFDLFDEYLDVRIHNKFFRMIGVSDNHIRLAESGTSSDKVYELLKNWMQRQGLRADINDLLNTLLTMDQRRSAESIASEALRRGYYKHADTPWKAAGTSNEVNTKYLIQKDSTQTLPVDVVSHEQAYLFCGWSATYSKASSLKKKKKTKTKKIKAKKGKVKLFWWTVWGC